MAKEKQKSGPTSTNPPDGWVNEYEVAKSQVKKDKKSASKQLRVARAATKLRLWEKACKAARRGLEQNPTDEERKQLKICHAIAEQEEERKKKSFVKDRQYLEEIRPRICQGNLNVDTLLIFFEGSGYTNLNVLQTAALQGDLPFLEDLVALGCAIDFPGLKDHADGETPRPAPIGATALVLLCANLALYFCSGIMPSSDIAKSRTLLDGQLECAIRLVKLGANFNRKLEIPTGTTGNQDMDMLNKVYREFGLGGKSVRQLATIIKKKKLIEAIEEMSDEERAVELVQCRCGSRLPWLQCHAGRRDGESPHYQMSSDKSRRIYRYSPLAPCPCKLTSKTHYSCCWNSAMPTYQDDTTGELSKTQSVSANAPGGKDAIAALLRRQRTIDAGESVLGGLSSEEFSKLSASAIRTMGQPGLRAMAAMKDPKCTIGEWDPDVYAGCMERIDDPFFWTNVHWALDKSEILLRVKEWNAALEKYCDDVGLTGDERAAVVEKHTASPCAPCANPGCDKIEESVKEFKRCNRCKSVSYCSVKCQKSDWRLHKQSCIGPSTTNWERPTKKN
jgi:hypothetical protein